MSSHVFHDIYLHLNWHTQGDLPLLKPNIARQVREFIQDRCSGTKGVYYLGIGGTPTHIHLLLKVEPFVCPSKLVGDLKGASAREINARTRRQTLRWQRGFGIVSFAGKHLNGMLRYLARQEKHHAAGTLKKTLERHTFEAPQAA